MDKPQGRGRPVPGGDANEATAEIERLIRAVLRAHLHWKVVVISGVIGMVGGAVAFKAVPAKWTSSTVVVFREGIATSSSDRATDKIKTLSTTFKEVMNSSTVLQPIVKDFNLFTTEWDGDDVTDAISKLREKITFEKRADDTFSVSYDGDSADAAKAVAERLRDGTATEILRVYRTQTKSEADFLLDEQKQREKELKDLEGEQARFLVAHPEFAEDTKGAGQAGAAIRSAVKEEEQKAAASGAAPVDKNRDKELQTQKQMADQELGKSRQTLTDKQRALAELQQRYTDKHPEVRAAADAVRIAQSEVAAKQAASDEAQRRIQTASLPAASLPKETDPYLAAEKERALAPLAAASAKLDAGTPLSDEEVVSAETEWARLQRDLAELRKRLDGLRADAFAARLRQSSTASGYSDSFEVVNPAFVPTEPKQPAPILIAIGVAVMGWFMGAAIAVIISIFDNRLFDRTDVGRWLEVLAVVPKDQPPRKVRFPRIRAKLLAFRARLALALRWVLTLGRREHREEPGS